MPQVEFILGMTLNDRAKFDEVLIKMTQPKGAKRGGPKMEIEQTLALFGMSLVRTDDAVFLCHNKFAREVEAGKSVKPISEKHRKTCQRILKFLPQFPEPSQDRRGLDAT